MRKLCILRREGGVAKHFNLRAGVTTVIVYAHDVEPPLARGWKPPQIVARHLRHFPSLVPIHRRFGALHIPRRPRLNLYKTKHIFLPSDQVDLSTMAWRPKVARYDHIAFLSQMEVRILLAPHPHSQMSRPATWRKHPVCKPVQGFDQNAGQLMREVTHTGLS